MTYAERLFWRVAASLAFAVLCIVFSAWLIMKMLPGVGSEDALVGATVTFLSFCGLLSAMWFVGGRLSK